ncbi:hypothetical protein KIPB_015357, partial [Kipferlia bialata]|eukprot:g15357.t1
MRCAGARCSEALLNDTVERYLVDISGVGGTIRGVEYREMFSHIDPDTLCFCSQRDLPK